MWWLELADYFVLKSRLLHNTTERRNIWFFLILKTLGLFQSANHHLHSPVVQSGLAGHTLALPGVGNAGQGTALVLGSSSSAPSPGASNKGWQSHWMPPPTSSALGDLPLTAWVRTRLMAKPVTFLKQNWGLGFAGRKKKRTLKKSNKNWNLFQSKINGSTQALQLLQNPPALQSPSSTNTNRNKRLLTEDPQLCSPLVANLRGLLVPAWSTQLATLPPASTSLSQQHYLVPLKSHHGCHTAERDRKSVV